MYSYEEALQSSIEYFDGEELAARVFLDKYALRNENSELLEKTPDDMHHRLAKEFARIEAKKFKKPLSESTIYNLFKKFGRIICQGSPMMGIGNNHQICSLSNCFVLTSPVDSYAGILYTDQQLVQIAKRRGGCGIDISHLRPTSTPTKNSSRTSTGTLSWMERYSNSTREVGQGGRRGALMLTISVHHPDVLIFATAKNGNDKGGIDKVTGANISIKLSDEFLKAVENNEEYEQRWPVDSKTPSITKMVKARDVWKKIIYSAWFRAEPGLLFWDNILNESPADCYWEFGFRTISTNPCQPGWAKLLTKDGIRELKDIQIGTEIWSENGWTTVKNKWSTGIKNVYKYTTTAGIFYGTENHKILSNNEKIEAAQADNIDIISGPNFDSQIIPQIVMDGLVIGDGTVHKASNNLILLDIGENDTDYFSSEIKNFIIRERKGIGPTKWEVSAQITSEELPLTYNRAIPKRYLEGNINEVSSFLRGLYSANGSICGNRITLKATSFCIIEDVQCMLSSLGIRSYWTKNLSKSVEFENGTYQCKESYDLNISIDRDIFKEKIGFIQKYKMDNIISKKSSRIKTNYDIISVDLVSKEEVFDITVDNATHTYWTQGCNVSNCGEIPLSLLDSCRLMALNLTFYVKNKFKKDAYFDYTEFYEDVMIAQRLMDDLVDLELEAVDKIIAKINSDPEDKFIKQFELELWQKIRKACIDGRRTGLGITGLGDTIASLNIKYGSKDGIETVGEIYKTLKFGSYQSSVDMAKELGPFPIWDWEKEKDNPFLLRIKNEEMFDNSNDKILHCSGKELYENIKKYGRRNIANLTTAPTGSLSILASMEIAAKYYYNITSGIECVFSIVPYTRKKKGNPSDDDFKTDFVDQNGDHWMNFDVYHSGIQAWMDVTGIKDVKKSPYFNASSADLDWIQRVKVQAEAQKHVDHSISSTINLPNDATEELVAEIYETAWKSGCKGITVYRDGCRTGVLVKKQGGVPKHDAPQRPKEIGCDVHHVSVKGKKYFVLVGKLEDDPYEVFAGRGNLISDKIEKGKIVRLRTSFYKAILDDETELSPITLGCDESEETITRLTSGMLRHGAGVEFVVEQLQKVEGDLTSFAKAISRVLKKYIADGTKSSQKCECGSELIFAEGCQKCLNCGSSKCG